MQRRSVLLTFTATAALLVFLASAPLAQAEVHGYQYATAAQLATRGSILDQFDSMLNNLTKRFDINPLAPANPQVSPKAATPSVKITDVKASSSGQSNAKQQVTVTLQNGNAAANGVRVSAYYSTTAGSTASSDSTVVSLNAGETRAIQFSPSGLAAGSYGVSVVAFKDGTDPSNKATPPYDMRENAATLSVTPTPTAAPTEKATEAQDTPTAFGDVLNQVNTWIVFIIGITALITIALFFVFSQNKSGGDRFEEDHFRDEYPPGDADQSKMASPLPLPPSSTGRAPTEVPDTVARPRRRQIAIEAAEPDEYAQAKPYDAAHPSSADRGFNSDGFVVGDVSSKKALRNKIRGKKGA
ncbi:MAG: hypothetical protein ACXVIG_02170 [Halobacteriota archaeon]